MFAAPSNGLPKCDTVFVIQESTARLLRTSSGVERMFLGEGESEVSVVWAVWRRVALASARERRHPREARMRAVDSPMPEAAPVRAMSLLVRGIVGLEIWMGWSGCEEVGEE